MSIETEYMRYFAEKHRDENEGAEGRKVFLGLIIMAASMAAYYILGYIEFSIGLAGLGIYLMSGFKHIRAFGRKQSWLKHT